MSNRELLEGLLDMVRFGWIWVGVCWTTRLQYIAQNCRILSKIIQISHKLPEYCPNCLKHQNIAQNCTSAQGTPHPEHNSLNHCHHPTPYSQQKRTAYSASTFSTPIILFFVASRSCLVSCQSDSIVVAICSLKSHRSRF